MMTCTRCHEEQPIDEFYRDKNRKSGRYPICKTCKREYDNKRYAANPEKRKAQMRKWALKSGYGISVDEYDVMLASQSGQCRICGATQGWANKRLAVDHDHETGAVRALLCDRCNLILGKAGDSPELLLKAAAYLKDYEE